MTASPASPHHSSANLQAPVLIPVAPRIVPLLRPSLAAYARDSFLGHAAAREHGPRGRAALAIAQANLERSVSTLQYGAHGPVLDRAALWLPVVAYRLRPDR